MTTEVLRAAPSDTARREVELLVDAAFRVIAATGSVDPLVRDILKEAGVSTPVFYRHFRSKDELLVTVWERGAHILAEYLQRRMSATHHPPAGIRAWIEGVMRQAGDPRTSRRTRPFAIGGPALPSQFPAEHERMTSLLTGPLAGAIRATADAGLCTSEDPDADARIIYDFVFARLRSVLIDGNHPDARTSDELVTFAFRALHVVQ